MFIFEKNDTQVATVTFKSVSEAKKALALHGKAVRGFNVEIEKDFIRIDDSCTTGAAIRCSCRTPRTLLRGD